MPIAHPVMSAQSWPTPEFGAWRRFMPLHGATPLDAFPDGVHLERVETSQLRGTLIIISGSAHV